MYSIGYFRSVVERLILLDFPFFDYVDIIFIIFQMTNRVIYRQEQFQLKVLYRKQRVGIEKEFKTVESNNSDIRFAP